MPSQSGLLDINAVSYNQPLRVENKDPRDQPTGRSFPGPMAQPQQQSPNLLSRTQAPATPRRQRRYRQRPINPYLTPVHRIIPPYTPPSGPSTEKPRPLPLYMRDGTSTVRPPRRRAMTPRARARLWERLYMKFGTPPRRPQFI
ncbi:hypothetical protein Dda_0240 [Drechslerella dactyloides]|uniref:Uncharacterized protein n=1 Tax=Drechslerella dactyloides TaxID=74499 RepID=A0AAD6NP05_DREDA|nr:hypothetical protein Dda_0240 [Drechslerella dactyloides]